MPIASRIPTALALCLLLATAPHAFAEAPKLDCSAKPGADKPVALNIDGNPQALPIAQFSKQQEMSVNEEAFDVFRVSLRDTESLFSPHEVDVSVLVKKGEKVDGKTFRLLPVKEIREQPTPVKSEGTWLPEVQSMTVRSDPDGFEYEHGVIASMRLEFGDRKDEGVPGRIHLCIAAGQKDDVFLPEPTRAIVVEGTFVAAIQ